MNVTASKGRKLDEITNERKYFKLHVQEDGSYGKNFVSGVKLFIKVRT